MQMDLFHSSNLPSCQVGVISNNCLGFFKQQLSVVAVVAMQCNCVSTIYLKRDGEQK